MATVDAHDARGRGWVMAELCELGGAALIPDELGKRRGHDRFNADLQRGDDGAPRACTVV